MVLHFPQMKSPSLLNAGPNINFPPLLADLFSIHSTHFVQIFATFATIWQFLVWAYLTNSPSFAHPCWPNAHPPPLPLPTLQIDPWWFLSRVLIQVYYTTKYIFIYAKCISVALQMGKGVMRRKWGNRGSLQSTLLISTQITVRHCLHSGCSAMGMLYTEIGFLHLVLHKLCIRMTSMLQCKRAVQHSLICTFSKYLHCSPKRGSQCYKGDIDKKLQWRESLNDWYIGIPIYTVCEHSTVSAKRAGEGK